MQRTSGNTRQGQSVCVDGQLFPPHVEDANCWAKPQLPRDDLAPGGASLAHYSVVRTKANTRRATQGPRVDEEGVFAHFEHATLTVPIDADGFTRSFAPNQVIGIIR